MISRELLQQLESCRPDHPDHLETELNELNQQLANNPELVAYKEKTEQQDRLIRDAMEEVELPLGLEARILQSLQQAASATPSEQEQPVQSEASRELVSLTSPESELVQETKPTLWRRHVLWAALAASVMLVVGGWWFQHPNDRGQTVEFAVQEGFSIYNHLAAAKPVKKLTLPFSPQIEERYVLRQLAFQDSHAYGIYRLEDPRSKVQGVLIVRRLHGKAKQLPNRPGKAFNTGQLWGTAWQDNKSQWQFVLVIEGTREDRTRVNYFLKSSDWT
ncbi:Hypothetical protein PBC10988_11160 [Planctomycetales bacterium 10988]|nr:Hypothetical protein PBC10988_11160 [Planctomycetales bacterium 10988]